MYSYFIRFVEAGERKLLGEKHSAQQFGQLVDAAWYLLQRGFQFLSFPVNVLVLKALVDLIGIFTRSSPDWQHNLLWGACRHPPVELFFCGQKTKLGLLSVFKGWG